MDVKTFPDGPGLYSSNPYFEGGDDYKGPYTEPGRASSTRSRSTATTITIKMAKPFPDMAY